MKAKTRETNGLRGNASFAGLTVTQFLGAFNDNLYKQLLLLIALDYRALHKLGNDPFQAIATLAFSIPFVLLSGFAGFLSDRFSKRSMIVVCKVLEIGVMGAAMAAFLTGEISTGETLAWLIVVLFFMGAQSALFGPSKYGILPEMLSERDLPAANGVIQMTTFLAIIFGTALSGFLKDAFSDQLWIVSGLCVVIAVFGTLASLLVTRTPAASPRMKFSPECLIVERSACRYILGDRQLLGAMLAYVVFWFAGALMLPMTNLVAREQLGYSDTTTSICVAFIGLGIAAGCLVCGRWSGGRVRFSLVRLGGRGLVFASLALVLVSNGPMFTASLRLVLFCTGLFLTGFLAGVFAVPLQVFVQARPPAHFTGRVLGAVGLMNWIGITLAAGFYFLLTQFKAATNTDSGWLFLSVGVLFAVVVGCFRQPDPPPSREK